ncbi:uncharacterized protein [Pyrus communis]|uniref:uncharacterized protein n=1 Tax=Pyrus communis TaxID=23211 RepID=UPI0035C1F1FA
MPPSSCMTSLSSEGQTRFQAQLCDEYRSCTVKSLSYIDIAICSTSRLSRLRRLPCPPNTAATLTLWPQISLSIRAASGFVIGNDLGLPILAGARGVGQSTINAMECIALHDGLRLVASRGFKRIIVEGDSKLVIEAVRGSYHVPWRLRTILANIPWLANSFEDISWKYVFLEANFLEDAITSVGHSVVDTHVWDRTIYSGGGSCCFAL